MTKQQILDHFYDINLAYNDSSKHETLSRMIDELLEAEKTKAIENIDLYIADAKSDVRIPSRVGKGYSVGLGHGLSIAKEILQGVRNHG